jgi:hypothetical protein
MRDSMGWESEFLFILSATMISIALRVAAVAIPPFSRFHLQ